MRRWPFGVQVVFGVLWILCLVLTLAKLPLGHTWEWQLGETLLAAATLGLIFWRRQPAR